MKSTTANRFSERACEPLLGTDDGKRVFESLITALKNKTVAAAA